jgi:hypothetical protein
MSVEEEPIPRPWFTIVVQCFEASRFLPNVRVPPHGKINIPYYHQDEVQGFDVNRLTLKKLKVTEPYVRVEDQRWELHVTGDTQVEGKIVTHRIRQVLKDNYRLDEYPFLMSMAKYRPNEQAIVTCVEFNMEKSLLRERNLNPITEVDDRVLAEIAAAKKLFRNREVDHSTIEQQAIDIWLDRYYQGKPFWNIPDNGDIISHHTTSSENESKPRGQKRTRKK